MDLYAVLIGATAVVLLLERGVAVAWSLADRYGDDAEPPETPPPSHGRPRRPPRS